MWKDKVRKVYSSIEELAAYDRAYSICSRLGYEGEDAVDRLWYDNPEIQGSINASDLKIVEDGLNKNQVRRQNFVDNEIYWLLTHLAEDITNRHAWNIEDFSRIREVAQEIIYQDDPNGISRELFDMEFYPYLKDEEDMDDFERDWCDFCAMSCVADDHRNCPHCGNPVDTEE